MGSKVGFAITKLRILPSIPTFFATPYPLKGSKRPEDDYQKAQSRGMDYLESFQAEWKKETRSKKMTHYKCGHILGISVGVVGLARFLTSEVHGLETVP